MNRLTPWMAAAMLAGSQLSTMALGTVDVYNKYAFPYVDLASSGDTCIGYRTALSEIGIVEAATAEASFSPAYMLRTHTQLPNQQIDVNLLTAEVAATVTYDDASWDATDNILSTRFELDVSAVTDHYGDTAEGRAAAVRYAKLAIITINEDMQLQVGSYYRAYKVTIDITGLPSQDGLEGTPVYASTNSPYTATSDLLNDYRAEVLNETEGCIEGRYL